MTESRVVSLRAFAVVGRGRGRIVLPPDVVRVDRPSPWGNPYRIGRWDVEEDGRPRSVVVDRDLALELFRGHAVQRLAADPLWLRPLNGKRLACWCAPLPCHADILVELGA